MDALHKKRALTHVNSELPQIRVELTREAQASCDTGHDDRDEVVEVSIRWCCQFEGPEADIVKGFVIDAESLVGVLDELVHGECGIVGLQILRVRIVFDGKG
jgi:hypothetical protein